jgi:uncharacterized protein (TIGR02453 family)
MSTPDSLFTPRSLSFLRSLKRNNRSDWFRERRDDYETHVRLPMIALIERLAVDFDGFAPELLASSRASLYRPYRDTRFSEDKRPLKTHISAVFPWRGLERHEGAGLYLEVTIDGAWVGGGMYAPRTGQLQLVREHLAANFKRFRSIVEAPRFRRTLGRVYGDSLQRIPRGFPPAHEASEYLKLRQYLASREYPPDVVTSPRFYGEVLKVFRLLAPMVRFLNEPLT